MARSNIANHSLRLNLDNEQHRRVEKVLANLNLDVHKSINQFLVDAADAHIKRLEGSELTYDDIPKKEEKHYLTMDDIEGIRREIRDELQQEIISTLASALAVGRESQISEVRTAAELSAVNEEEEIMEADATTLGLASSWG